MPSQVSAAGVIGGETTCSRNWALIAGRVALVWALVEATTAGVANLSGGSLLGVSEKHFALDAIVAALVGIGFVLDGSARSLVRVS